MPPEYHISYVINIEDLFPFRGNFEHPVLICIVASGVSVKPVVAILCAAPSLIGTVEQIFYNDITTGHHFLVRLHGLPSLHDLWMSIDELHLVSLLLLKEYMPSTLLTSVLNSGEMMQCTIDRMHHFIDI